MLAPLTSRLLAGFIDYLVVSLSIFLFASSVPGIDFDFLIVFVVGLLYFGFGNSNVWSGQTLGKKAFGIRVAKIPRNDGGESENEELPLLTIVSGMLRYLATYGILLLLGELPPLLYRNIGLQASQRLLDLPMLIALIYSFSNTAVALFSVHRRGLHDSLCNSIVLRASCSPDQLRQWSIHKPALNPISLVFPLVRKRSVQLVSGAFLGVGFWLLSVSQPAPVTAFYEARFSVEHELSVRFLGASLRRLNTMGAGRLGSGGEAGGLTQGVDSEELVVDVISLDTADARSVAEDIRDSLTRKVIPEQLGHVPIVLRITSLPELEESGGSTDIREFRVSVSSDTIEEILSEPSA